MSKLTRTPISKSLLLFIAVDLVSACQILDNDSYQEKRAFDLLSQKKFEKAAEIFQHSAQRFEHSYQDVKSLTPSPKSSENEKEIANKLANAYYNLALVFFESGKYGQAEQILQNALATYDPYFGRENEFSGKIIGLLATSYFKQGKLIEAERFYEEELEVKKKLYKADSLVLAVIANNLASIYQKLGDANEAEKYFRWALNLCENCKKSQTEMDQLADILNNLALFYQKQEFYVDARDTVNKALAIEDANKGDEFLVDKVRSLMVLALIEKSTFDLDSSEDHYQEALKLIEENLPARADLNADALEKYAELLYSERRYAEAEPVFEKCLKAAETAHGPEHPVVANVLSEFSQVYKRTDRDAQAEQLLKRALTIQEKTIGIDTAEFLSTVHRLATVYADQNRFPEVNKLYEDVLPRLKAIIGPEHPFVADSYDNWASFLERNNAGAQAKHLRTDARYIRRKIAQSLYTK